MMEAKYSTRRKALDGIKKDQASTAHLGLWLEKYIESTYREPEDKDTTQGELLNATRKNLIQEAHQLSVQQSADADYTLFFGRYQAALQSLGATCQAARVLGRMVVGLGSESVWENSLSIHRTYGVPFIPGSALKGLCSSYAHRFLGEAWQKGSQAQRSAFGETDSRGYVQFFDALPVPQSWSLEREVMTVHHQDYYSGKAAPSDWDDPNPIPFVSATGTYLIAFLAPEGWQASVLELLELALEQEGIGAKTSSGYGRLEFLDSPRKARLDAEQALQKQQSVHQEALERLVKKVTDLKPQHYNPQMPTIVKDLKQLEPHAQQQAAKRIMNLLREKKLLKEFKGRAWLTELQALEEA
ncbi:MAG: type III-B CRISPR module RAMP protein Cmr6 [Deinococcales bacterium]